MSVRPKEACRVVPRCTNCPFLAAVYPDLNQSAGDPLQAPLCPPPRPVPKVIEQTREITKEIYVYLRVRDSLIACDQIGSWRYYARSFPFTVRPTSKSPRAACGYSPCPHPGYPRVDSHKKRQVKGDARSESCMLGTSVSGGSKLRQERVTHEPSKVSPRAHLLVNLWRHKLVLLPIVEMTLTVLLVVFASDDTVLFFWKVRGGLIMPPPSNPSIRTYNTQLLAPAFRKCMIHHSHS